MFDDKKLDFYIDKGYNVLFRGRHGVGKTAIVKEAFERHNLKWKYFSAATMDPWVDFVGIPKEVKDPETGESYIDLIRPKGFQNDDVEAIFMDELNRAKPKVRNAVMELIQFRSINGVPFRNLKMIWAAINPEDDEADLHYDVEELDEAQKDRFHIILDIPYEPSREYFVKQFGKDVGGGAVEWWKGLTPEQNILVSPRRLEFALDVHQSDGDIRDVLPNKQLNLSQLRQRIEHGSISAKLKELFSGDDEDCRKTFNNMNFVTDAVPHIVKKAEYLQRFGQFLHRDILSDLITEDEGKHCEKVIKNIDADVITPILASIVSSGSVKRTILTNIKNWSKERGLDLTSENAFKTSIEEALGMVGNSQVDRYHSLHAVFNQFNRKAPLETYAGVVKYIAMMINHCTDKSLKDTKKPFSQLGVELMHLTDKALTANHDTTFMDLWADVKAAEFAGFDAVRLERVEKNLQDFINTPPKRS